MPQFDPHVAFCTTAAVELAFFTLPAGFLVLVGWFMCLLKALSRPNGGFD
jgi:hypothetical protein